MLHKLSEEVASCYDLANESRARADNSSNETDRQKYLEFERRWIMLARSYELSERITLFTDEVQRRQASDRSGPSSPAPSSARELAEFFGVHLGDGVLLRRDGLRLVKAFMAICNPDTRAQLVELAELAVRNQC